MPLTRTLFSLPLTLSLASLSHSSSLTLLSHSLPNSHSLFQEVLPELKRATKYGKGPAVKVAAADALALCCFVAAEDESTTGEVMDHLQSLWRKGECVTFECYFAVIFVLPVKSGVLVGSEGQCVCTATHTCTLARPRPSLTPIMAPIMPWPQHLTHLPTTQHTTNRCRQAACVSAARLVLPLHLPQQPAQQQTAGNTHGNFC